MRVDPTNVWQKTNDISAAFKYHFIILFIENPSNIIIIICHK